MGAGGADAREVPFPYLSQTSVAVPIRNLENLVDIPWRVSRGDSSLSRIHVGSVAAPSVETRVPQCRHRHTRDGGAR